MEWKVCLNHYPIIKYLELKPGQQSWYKDLTSVWKTYLWAFIWGGSVYLLKTSSRVQRPRSQPNWICRSMEEYLVVCQKGVRQSQNTRTNPEKNEVSFHWTSTGPTVDKSLFVVCKLKKYKIYSEIVGKFTWTSLWYTNTVTYTSGSQPFPAIRPLSPNENGQTPL